MHVCTYSCMYVRMHVCTYACMYVCVCVCARARSKVNVILIFNVLLNCFYYHHILALLFSVCCFCPASLWLNNDCNVVIACLYM